MYVPKLALAILLFPQILLGLRLIFHTSGTVGAVIAAIAVIAMVYIPSGHETSTRKNRHTP